MSERSATPDGGITLSDADEEKIEAWERKRAQESGSERGDDLSDDAESGGP